MRELATIEKLYLDFDGFFALSCSRPCPNFEGGRVIPFETLAANSTIVIACSKEAKAKKYLTRF
jgi:DNA polymerase-4